MAPAARLLLRPLLIRPWRQLLISTLHHLSRRLPRLRCQYRLPRSRTRLRRSRRLRASRVRLRPLLPRRCSRQHLSRRPPRLRCQYRLPRSRRDCGGRAGCARAGCAFARSCPAGAHGSICPAARAPVPSSSEPKEIHRVIVGPDGWGKRIHPRRPRSLRHAPQ